MLTKHIKELKAQAFSVSNLNDFHMPKIVSLYEEQLLELTKKKIYKILKMEYDRGQILKNLKSIEDEEKILKKEAIADKLNNRYIFLTINPPQSCNLDILRKAVSKAVTRKFVKTFHYVFEQRSKTIKDLGQGLHCHLLFERDLNYKPSIIKRDLKNTFKHCYKNKLTGNNLIKDYNFNFKKCGKEFYEKRLMYIKGNKTEEGKDDKMSMDILYRKKNNLESLYEKYYLPYIKTN